MQIKHQSANQQAERKFHEKHEKYCVCNDCISALTKQVEEEVKIVKEMLNLK